MVLLFCAFLSAAQPADMVTEPERCVFLGAPYQMAYLRGDNLLLAVNGGGVYAFDAATGAQRWHRYLVSPRGYRGVQFGKRQVLGWSEQGVFLLDAATGRETWWRRDGQCGDVYSARLSPDESRVVVIGEQACLLYGVKDRTQRVLPAMPGFQGWLPGGQALLFAKYGGDEEERIRTWQIMDADTGTVTPCWEEPYSWEIPAPSLSSLGQFADVVREGENPATLRIRDARTGTVLREFKDAGDLTRYAFWMQDGRRLFSTTADRKEARVIDAETGAVQFALFGGDHRFLLNAPFEDADGTAWVFSKDGANHRHAWRLAPDGAPIKVLDGARFAPGNFYFDRSEPGRLVTMNMEEDRLWVYAVHSLEDLHKLAEWRCRVPKQIYAGFYINKALTHGACSHQIRPDNYNRARNKSFAVYVRDRETPVRTGPGNVMAMSPDGKHLALQTDDREACLYDVEAGRIVSVYTVPGEDDDYQCSMNAVFSEDGRRMALNTTKSIEVTDLAEGYPRRSMAFGENKRLWWPSLRISPDGNRVLCGGDNCAWLFDAATGARLHSLAEPERFADLYSYRGGGFWSSLAETAKDWAGLVTDRFRQAGQVQASFAGNGSRVITHAAGQVLRVWDAESGRMQAAIHSGLPEKRNRYGQIRNQITLSGDGRFAFCSNADNYAPASLWSVAGGTLLRLYELPESDWLQASPAGDGKAVHVISNGNLYRWPGAPQDVLDQLPVADE